METRDLCDQTGPILSAYGVKKAAVFGSYSRGDQRASSDVDILVELGRRMSLLDFVGLKLELEEKLGKKVDLVQYKTIKPSMRKSILGGELVFYQS